jgi:hypothetical protein
MFDGLICKRWGTSINAPKSNDAEKLDNNKFEEHEDQDEPKRTAPNIKDTVNANGESLNQQPAHNKILQSEVSLKLGESMTVGKATKHAIGAGGTVAGTYDEILFLNTMIYEVAFPDGQLKELAANVVAENMLTQVDSDGFSLTMMESVTGCQKDEAAAVPKINKHVTTTSGQKKRLRKTTAGWSPLVKQTNGSHPCSTCLSHDMNGRS